MAVQRDRITVFPPEGETVAVDILDTGVSIGTAHAERTTTRTLTLPATISARTSFYVPAGSGPYDVSVKLDGKEIAGADGTAVTVSNFPAEVRTRINAAELGDVAGASGGSAPVSWAYLTSATDGTNGAHHVLSWTVVHDDGSDEITVAATHIAFAFDGVAQIAFRPVETDHAATAPTVWPQIALDDASAAIWAAGYFSDDAGRWQYPEGASPVVVLPPFHVADGDWLEFGVQDATDFLGCKAWVVRLA